jgi:LysR family carnitine catabolism transcriptional activator
MSKDHLQGHGQEERAVGMRVTLRQLEAFVQIAELSSITAAAGRMGLTQPSVSGLIRDLEQAFGTSLLDRTTRSVQLTEAGRTVLRRAKMVLSETGTLVEELQGLRQGTSGALSVAATTAVSASLLPRILVDLRTHMPDLKTIIHDVHLEHLHETVLSGAADLGIGAATSHPELEVHRLVSDSLALIVPGGSRLAERAAMTWDEAARERTITIRNTNVVRNIMNATLQISGIGFVPTIEVNMVSTALAMTAEGLGHTILPPFLVPHMRMGDFAVVRLMTPVVPQQISIFSKRNRSLSPSAELFRNLVIKHFASLSNDVEISG